MTIKTIAVRILSVASGESLVQLAPETLAVRPARFENLYRAHHGAGVEVPADVPADARWAGGDAETQAAHEALVSDLWDAATRLDAMDAERPCYVLFEGAGADESDVWSRCEIVATEADEAHAQHVVVDGGTFGVDTPQEIRTARAALIRAGLADAPVFAGTAPDAVRTSSKVFAAVPVLVSWDNGASTELATDTTAGNFLARYGEENVAALLREHDLPTEDYDSPIAVLAALDACCAEGEIPTLP